MKRISMLLIPIIFLSFGITTQAKAIEPALNFFDTVMFPEMLQNDVYKMKCTISWDPSSKMTEIMSLCIKKDNEIYVHGNATSQGVDKTQYAAGPISYLSFTVKSVDAYKNFAMYAQMCAGAVNGVKNDAIASTIAWIKKSYMGLANKQKVSKKMNGHDVSVIGGVGSIRILTCGAKPRS